MSASIDPHADSHESPQKSQLLLGLAFLLLLAIGAWTVLIPSLEDEGESNIAETSSAESPPPSNEASQTDTLP